MIEQLIEEEMKEYWRAAYATHGDTKSQLKYFANEILEVVAQRCETKVKFLSGIDCEGASERIICAKELAVDIRNLKVKV